MLAHEEKGLLRISLLEPIDGFVGGNVGAVTGELFFAAIHLKKNGVVVTSLPGENFPVVEADGIRNEMPLPDDRGVITSAMKRLSDGPLGLVEASSGIAQEAVFVAVLSGENSGATRPTDGVSTEGVFEDGTTGSQAVDVRSGRYFGEIAPVSRDRAEGVVIRKEEENIWLLGTKDRGHQSEQEEEEFHGGMRYRMGELWEGGSVIARLTKNSSLPRLSGGHDGHLEGRRRGCDRSSSCSPRLFHWWLGCRVLPS